MRQHIAPVALAILLAQPALAQDTPEPAPDPVAEPETVPAEPAPQPAEPDSPGLSSGAVGDTFFIRTPLEYHMLASELVGQPIYFDTTIAVGQTAAIEPTAGDDVEEEIREAERPLGAISDVLIDRAGQVAALVIELDPELSGSEREVAVAGGLVRMLPVSDDPNKTVLMLTLDPIDLENAPEFQRTQEAGEAEVQP